MCYLNTLFLFGIYIGGVGTTDRYPIRGLGEREDIGEEIIIPGYSVAMRP